MNTQIMLIITGLPFSGKTTLTRALVKRCGFTVASVDEVLREGKYKVEKMTQKDWESVYSEAYARLKARLSSGESVIFDGGSLLKSERKTLKEISKKVNIPHKLIYVNTPRIQIDQRRLENMKVKKRDYVKKKTMSIALSMFEEPSKRENAILFNEDTDLESWIKENL